MFYRLPSPHWGANFGDASFGDKILETIFNLEFRKADPRKAEFLRFSESDSGERPSKNTKRCAPRPPGDRALAKAGEDSISGAVLVVPRLLALSYLRPATGRVGLDVIVDCPTEAPVPSSGVLGSCGNPMKMYGPRISRLAGIRGMFRG